MGTSKRQCDRCNKWYAPLKPWYGVCLQCYQYMKNNPNDPHFRKYFPSGHPAKIEGVAGEKELYYRKVSHSEKDGNHSMEKVSPNPNPAESEPMYISNTVRKAPKGKFSDWIYPWFHKKKK